MNATSCESCDNVHAETRKQHPGRWVCVKFPRLEGMNAIAPREWVNAEPYMRCTGINGGHCPVWTPRRDGQRTLKMETSDVG